MVNNSDEIPANPVVGFVETDIDKTVVMTRLANSMNIGPRHIGVLQWDGFIWPCVPLISLFFR